MQKELLDLFTSPRVIGIVADRNEGKTNTANFIIEELYKEFDYSLYHYGFNHAQRGQRINSVNELESIENGIIFLDEFALLLDLDNRKQNKFIAKIFQTLFHHNNIIVLVGLPENYNKFISEKLHAVIFKRCSLDAFVNGSNVKRLCLNYKGEFEGATALYVPKDTALVFDGQHYTPVKIEYMQTGDTKRKNAPILTPKE